MNALLEGAISGWLLRNTGQAAVLVVLVLIVRWLMGERLAPRWRHFLWWLVVLRLTLPATPPSRLSIFNWTPKCMGWTERAADATPRFNAAPTVSDNAESLPTNLSAEISREPWLETEQVELPDLSSKRFDLIEPFRIEGTTAAVTVPRQHGGMSLKTVLIAVWLLGLAILVMHLIRSLLGVRRCLRAGRIVTDQAILGLLNECRSKMRIGRPVLIVETRHWPSPALCGLVHPRLLLPVGLLRQFDQAELRHVFLHELAHLQRHDIAINWLTTILHIIHWFNPLLWIAFHQMKVDGELDCDARVLEATRMSNPQAYGRTMIKVLEQLSSRVSVPGMVGILESKSQLKQRIRHITRFNGRTRSRVLSASIVLALSLIGLTDARMSPANQTAVSAASGAVGANAQAAALGKATRPAITNGPALKVRVADAVTSAPIQGAHVYMPAALAFYEGMENAPQWTTDAEGEAQIHLGELPRNSSHQLGMLNLAIRCRDYAPLGMSWSSMASEHGGKDDVRRRMPKAITARLERGTRIGGVIQDSQGRAIPRVKVHVRGCSFSSEVPDPPYQVYAEYRSDSTDLPEAVTDRQGRWTIHDFPLKLTVIVIECTRPDGSLYVFRQSSREHSPTILYTKGDPINIDELYAGRAVFVLKPGFKIQGLVVDPTGKPVSGVLLKEGFGVNRRLTSEFYSDSQGRFTLNNRPRRQVILTAQANGFAVTSLIVDVASEMPDVRLQLQPTNSLRLKVVDEQGNPVRGATVSVDDQLTEGQFLDFSGMTRDDGTLVWTNAPRSAFALRIKDPSCSLNRLLRLNEDQRQVTCKIRQGEQYEVAIRGQALDADTGEPVVVESLAWQGVTRAGFENPDHIGQSDFAVRIPRSLNNYNFKLQVRAENYKTQVTDWRSFDEGDWNVIFRMQKGVRQIGGIRYWDRPVKIMLPNGEPAIRAKALVAGLENAPMVCFESARFSSRGLSVHSSDGDGCLWIVDIGWDAGVVITHDAGYRFTSLSQLKDQSQLELNAWGRIEGTLRVSDQPRQNREIGLMGGGKIGLNLWNLSYFASAQEQFRFEKVPAGDYVLYQRIGQGPGRIIHSHPMVVKVRSGQTTTVDYEWGGRSVVGRIAGTAGRPGSIQAVLQKQSLDSHRPYTEDYATRAAFQAAFDAWNWRLDYALENLSYQFQDESLE